MKPRGPIVIVGFMGCGKTGVARELARQLDLAMIDLDERIAEQHGRSAAELIREDGEGAFRSLETATLKELLESRAAGVIALGGGAWITERNRELIAQYDGFSVWLDTPFEVCWQRIEASDDDRPLGRTRAEAEERYNQRQPLYNLATLRLHVLAGEPVETIVRRIVTENTFLQRR
jgi:shikimate kinase